MICYLFSLDCSYGIGRILEVTTRVFFASNFDSGHPSLKGTEDCMVPEFKSLIRLSSLPPSLKTFIGERGCYFVFGAGKGEHNLTLFERG